MTKGATVKVRNISPLGAIEVLGRLVEAGEAFDVSDEQGARLLEQSDNYESADVATEAKEAGK